MPNRPSLDDYVDVAERIQDFKDAHPNGSLQTIGWEIVTVEGVDAKTHKPATRTFVVYRAAAYRTPDDTTPGTGIAWEPFPGGTPYTKDSELMNAETAAWGRAIVALGLVANRSLASRQEVRNRREDQAAASESEPVADARSDSSVVPSTEPNAALEQQLADTRAAFVASGMTNKDVAWFLISKGAELPAEPENTDIGKAMRGLTLDELLEAEAWINGKDES